MNKRSRRLRTFMVLALATVILMFVSTSVFGQDETPPPAEPEETAVVEQVDAGPTTSDLAVRIDSGWVLITGMLVFFMQTGFAMLETGMIRQTGAVNALLENFIDAGLTAICFWAVGYGIAFGTSSLGGLIGTSNFFLSDAIQFVDGGVVFVGSGLSMYALWFFQFAFAATASTITTGAMAERTDFIGDLIYSAIMAVLIYPVVVHWVWGGGWLFERGFLDFAGSTVVHTVGGVVALTGAWMLGPRPNREFGNPPKPHNMALATIGAMILWFGWYGFNPGSTLGLGNHGLVALIALNTTLGGAAGALSAMFMMYFRTGKWDLSYTLNGSLAGLVGITAGCAFVAPWAAVVIGAVAGIVVILAIDFIESIKIDDAVGAFAVHGACGIWGTIAIGLLGQPELGANSLLLGGSAEQLVTQLIGSASVIAWSGVTAFVMFYALNMVGHLRVHPKADEIGIDVYEHGATNWPDVYDVEIPAATGD